MQARFVIDDDLLCLAQELTGIPTKEAVIEEALRLLIRVHQRINVQELRGQLHWEGNLDELREGRFLADHPSTP